MNANLDSIVKFNFQFLTQAQIILTMMARFKVYHCSRSSVLQVAYMVIHFTAFKHKHHDPWHAILKQQ